MKTMILAAGRGARMRPLTDAVPKPLIPLLGRALIEHHVIALRDAGIVEFVINLGWLGASLRDHLRDGADLGVKIAYSDEGWPALETGGGILRALPLLGEESFLLINGDVYTDYPWLRLLKSAKDFPKNDLAHLVLVPNPDHNPRGDFGLADGRIVAACAESLTYSGLAILRPALFAGCADGPFPLAPLLRDAAIRGQVGGELYRGLWSDVGTPERLYALEKHLQESLR